MAGGAAALIALAPVAQIVVRAVQGGERSLALLFRPRTLDLLLQTGLLVLLVCAVCLVLGTLIAAVLATIRLPAPRLWVVLVTLPLALPSYIGAFAWVSALPGRDGLLPLVVVLAATSLPLVVLPTAGALAGADRGPSDVARALGRGPVAAFRDGTLPQVLPAALAGTLLVALYVVADFGAPAILRYQTLTTGAHALFSGGADRSAAATVSLPIVLVVIACVLGERALRGDPARRARSGRTRVPHRRVLRRPSTVLACAALLAVPLVGVALPVAALAVRALRSERFGAESGEVLASAVTTLGLGAAAATAGALLALPVALLVARATGRIPAVVEISALVAHGLPGVVVALALVALALGLMPAIYQTTALLVLAYAVIFSALAIGPVRSAIEQVAVPARETARTLGDGPLRAWARITLPAALPGALAGWLLIATAAMKELPATLMLRPIGVETLATELWSRTSIGAYGAAAPIGLALVLVGLVPAALVARGVRGRELA